MKLGNKKSRSTFCRFRNYIEFTCHNLKTNLMKGGSIELNNLIKEKRTALALTQDGLAEKLEVSRQTIISLEKGRYNPSLILAFKIAKLFDCRIEDIFKPEEE